MSVVRIIAMGKRKAKPQPPQLNLGALNNRSQSKMLERVGELSTRDQRLRLREPLVVVGRTDNGIGVASTDIQTSFPERLKLACCRSIVL